MVRQNYVCLCKSVQRIVVVEGVTGKVLYVGKDSCLRDTLLFRNELGQTDRQGKVIHRVRYHCLFKFSGIDSELLSVFRRRLY
jgi:hypothetical protein